MIEYIFYKILYVEKIVYYRKENNLNSYISVLIFKRDYKKTQ